MDKVNTPIKSCLVCNGNLYDNRADKASGKLKRSYPDFKCKEDGDHAWYLDAKKGTTPPASHVLQEAPGQPPPAPEAPAAKYTWAELALTYQKCFTIASRTLPQGTMTGDQVAAAATLFIAAQKLGLKAGPKASAPARTPAETNGHGSAPAVAATPHRYFPPGEAARAGMQPAAGEWAGTASQPKAERFPADLPPEEGDDDLPF